MGNRGCDPFNQNFNRSDREKWSTSKGGPIFSKLFWLDRTDPLSFGPTFPEILVEWIVPRVTIKLAHSEVPRLGEIKRKKSSKAQKGIILFLCFVSPRLGAKCGLQYIENDLLNVLKYHGIRVNRSSTSKCKTPSG